MYISKITEKLDDATFKEIKKTGGNICQNRIT